MNKMLCVAKAERIGRGNRSIAEHIDPLVRQVLKASGAWEACNEVHLTANATLERPDLPAAGEIYNAWMQLTDVFDIGNAPLREAHAAIRLSAEEWLDRPPAADHSFYTGWARKADDRAKHLFSKYGLSIPWPDLPETSLDFASVTESVSAGLPVSVDEFSEHNLEIGWITLSGTNGDGVRWTFRVNCVFEFSSPNFLWNSTEDGSALRVVESLIGTSLVEVKLDELFESPVFRFSNGALIAVRVDMTPGHRTSIPWSLSLPGLPYMLTGWPFR